MSNTAVSRRRALTLLCALGVASSPLAQAATTAALRCAAGPADGIGTSGSADGVGPGGPAGGSDLARLADGIETPAIDELARELRTSRADAGHSSALADLLAGAPGQDAMIARLRERLTRDYADGRIVEVSGWWISRTEAALYVALSECRQEG